MFTLSTKVKVHSTKLTLSTKTNAKMGVNIACQKEYNSTESTVTAVADVVVVVILATTITTCLMTECEMLDISYIKWYLCSLKRRKR